MLDPNLLRTALSETDELAVRFPAVATIRSVGEQLRYLLDCAEGRTNDARLGEIVLGVQAAREIEPLDEALADKLHDIAAQVRESRSLA